MKEFIHYRHATSIIYVDKKRILIDPVFAPKESYPPIINSYNNSRNPLNDLTIDYKQLLNVDGVIITHNHNDHFDELAKKVLPRDLPILCQIEDYKTYKSLGFNFITPIDKNVKWLGFNCTRFIGTHGGHILHKKLGVSSGYLIEALNSTIYISGDTLLKQKMIKNIRNIKPDFIIANGGGARMKLVGKLTMSNRDIIKLRKISKNSKIIVVHMNDINHCLDKKNKLEEMLNTRNFNTFIPENGERILFK